MRKYTANEMHWLLIGATGFTESAGPERQAYRCPYYAPLRGVLSTDWGVCLSPTSTKFGQLLFEHDDCGCPEGTHGMGHQRIDEWRDKKREKAEAVFAGRAEAPDATIPDPASAREGHP